MELVLLAQNAPTLPSDTPTWIVILLTVASIVAGIVYRYQDLKLAQARAKVDTAENKVVRLQQQLDPTLEPPKILVIDDDANDFELFKILLESTGCAHKLLWETNGTFGYIAMRDNDVSLVLLDMKMVGNGEQFLKYVKADTRTRDVPVIVVSGVVPESIDVYQLGAIGYLNKPIHLSNMLQVLARHGFSWQLTQGE